MQWFAWLLIKRAVILKFVDCLLHFIVYLRLNETYIPFISSPSWALVFWSPEYFIRVQSLYFILSFLLSLPYSLFVFSPWTLVFWSLELSIRVQSHIYSLLLIISSLYLPVPSMSYFKLILSLFLVLGLWSSGHWNSL